MGIRIPSIRLRIEHDDTEGTSSLGAEAVGVALFVFCMLVVLAGNTAELEAASREWLRYGFGAGCSLALLAGAIADKRVHTMFKHINLAIAASVGCAVTSLALFGTALVGGMAGCVLNGAVGVLTGATAAVLLFYWAIAFSRMETVDIVVSSVAAVCIGFICFALCMRFVPSSLVHLVTTALPLLNIYLLRDRVTNRLRQPELRDSMYFSELNINRGAFALKTVPTMLAWGVAIEVLAHITFRFVDVTGSSSFLVSTILATVGCVLCAAWCIAFLRRTDKTFIHAFRLLVPVVAIIALPLPFITSGDVSPINLCILIDLMLCIMLAWAFNATISQDYRLSPVFMFGLGFSSILIGGMLATLLTVVAKVLPSGSLTPPGLALSSCLLAFVMVSGFFPRTLDIRAIVTKSFCPEAIRGDGDSAMADGDPSQAGSNSSSGETTLHVAQGSLDGDGAGVEGGTLENETPRRGRFIKRCEQVANTYLLSRREVDVLLLLAKGRNVSAIKEQLCISEGTAKTHVHHVYRKTGVHSQQELIDLVDSIVID